MLMPGGRFFVVLALTDNQNTDRYTITLGEGCRTKAASFAFLSRNVSLCVFQKKVLMKKLSMDELNRMSTEEFKKTGKNKIVVVLDNVRSLNNIGSIFRTSDAFLLEGIYLCGISATPPHKEIHKTALGAEDSVAWKYFSETTDAVNHLRSEGYALIAVEQTTNSISLEKFPVTEDKKYALIFGNEVKGVQQEIIDMCDAAVEIPQFGTKHSFNVSVSAGIVLWEWYRHLAKAHQ
jgi:tRNA G18 (ribose-2'-O)-methylase SpoU